MIVVEKYIGILYSPSALPTSFYLYCIGTSVCCTTSLFIVTPARLWYSNWYSEEQSIQQLLLAIAFPKDINMILWDTPV